MCHVVIWCFASEHSVVTYDIYLCDTFVSIMILIYKLNITDQTLGKLKFMAEGFGI